MLKTTLGALAPTLADVELKPAVDRKCTSVREAPKEIRLETRPATPNVSIVTDFMRPPSAYDELRRIEREEEERYYRRQQRYVFAVPRAVRDDFEEAMRREMLSLEALLPPPAMRVEPAPPIEIPRVGGGGTRRAPCPNCGEYHSEGGHK